MFPRALDSLRDGGNILYRVTFASLTWLNLLEICRTHSQKLDLVTSRDCSDCVAGVDRPLKLIPTISYLNYISDSLNIKETTKARNNILAETACCSYNFVITSLFDNLVNELAD